jgi:hypothetical protein
MPVARQELPSCDVDLNTSSSHRPSKPRQTNSVVKIKGLQRRSRPHFVAQSHQQIQFELMQRAILGSRSACKKGGLIGWMLIYLAVSGHVEFTNLTFIICTF